MAVISELIRTEENGKLSFGDYTLAAKAKLDNFEKDGDIYKVRPLRRLQSSKETDSLYTSLFREQRLWISRRLLIQ